MYGVTNDERGSMGSPEYCVRRARERRASYFVVLSVPATSSPIFTGTYHREGDEENWTMYSCFTQHRNERGGEGMIQDK